MSVGWLFPWGHPLGQGRLHKLTGEPLYEFFTSTIIADFEADYEPGSSDHVVVTLSREASGMTSEMSADGG